MPADIYVQIKFDEVLDEVFEGRRKLEKYLGRQDLLAYDRVLARFLKKDVIMKKMRREVYLDYNSLCQSGQMTDQAGDSANSREMQTQKTKNHQLSFTRAIANEDAIYKFLAYSGNLEQKRRRDREATRANAVLAQGGDTFE